MKKYSTNAVCFRIIHGTPVIILSTYKGTKDTYEEVAFDYVYSQECIAKMVKFKAYFVKKFKREIKEIKKCDPLSTTRDALHHILLTEVLIILDRRYKGVKEKVFLEKYLTKAKK